MQFLSNVNWNPICQSSVRASIPRPVHSLWPANGSRGIRGKVKTGTRKDARRQKKKDMKQFPLSITFSAPEMCAEICFFSHFPMQNFPTGMRLDCKLHLGAVQYIFTEKRGNRAPLSVKGNSINCTLCARSMRFDWFFVTLSVSFSYTRCVFHITHFISALKAISWFKKNKIT